MSKRERERDTQIDVNRREHIHISYYIDLSDIEKHQSSIMAYTQKYNVNYSDDEIGWFFKEIKKIQDALNEFTLK